MRWPEIEMEMTAAIEVDADAVAILGPAETQALYQEGTRDYQVPSLDFFLVAATKEEVSEPALFQFNGHATTKDQLIAMGNMLERLFDRDTWHTLGSIYMRSTKVQDGTLIGPDRNGRFHQSWDYEVEATRSKYGRFVASES